MVPLKFLQEVYIIHINGLAALALSVLARCLSLISERHGRATRCFDCENTERTSLQHIERVKFEIYSDVHCSVEYSAHAAF